MARRAVFEGVLADLPTLESKTIRVFFSSTFTDFTEERNVLMKEAVPYLRNYCIKQGLDFQVVDMRWGVRDEMSVDQMATELCLNEVQKCQDISMGPNFVIFLGDRYGGCPLPSTIPASDFKVFHHVAMAMEKDVYILDKWYLLDKNADPPVYQIQPITNILSHYKDQNPDNKQLQEKDERRWEDTEQKLKALFDQLGREAHRTGQMDHEAYHRYLISVTESEIKLGLLGITEVKDRVLCFHRSLQNIDIQHGKAWRFVDLNDDGSVNREARDLREKLILTKIPEALPPSQMHSYSISWSEAGGIDPEDTEHAAYLRTFSMDFRNSMKTMIDDRLAHGSSLHVEDLYAEILHHLHFGVRKSAVFFGREKELTEISEKLTKVVVVEGPDQDAVEASVDDENDNGVSEQGEEDSGEEDEEDKDMKEMLSAMEVKYHVGDAFDDYESDPNKNTHLQQVELPVIKAFKRPVVIYGESGSGKTALMAKVAQLSAAWIRGSALIVRYLGTSPKSSSIREVLVNICRQIWELYNIPNIGGIDLNDDFQYLISYFHALLWRIDSTSKPLMIILDSVDQLSPSDHSHTVNWLPTRLPLNVHVIISMMPGIHNCLGNTQQHLPFPEQFCQLSEFSEVAGNSMVSSLCSRKSRTLTRLQRNFLMEQFVKCPQPLFLKLIVDNALTWRSFTPLSDIQVGDSVRAAINALFDKLERIHGVVLISKAFGYLCAACQGLSDAEMEDILSLDDEVLQDTYLYHLPPDPEVVRLPPLLWKRVSSDISEYLVERRSGNQVVVNWYHRQFFEVASERYLDASPVQFHSSIAEYFSGEWSSVAKPLELFKVKKGSYPDASRRVPAQPLMFDNGSYNVRKLQELPHQLLESLDLVGFHRHVACSFQWLYATCKELSLTDIVASLSRSLLCHRLASDDAELSSVCSDIKFVRDMLVLASDGIRRNPVNLAIQIVSQLGPQHSGAPALMSLVRAAYAWLETHPQPLLLPQGRAMSCPGGCLLSSINVDINIQGNERVFSSCIEFHESKGELYVTEQHANKKNDCLRIYDLDDNMSCMAVYDLHAKVRSIKFKVAEKFLIMETYDHCTNFNFRSHFEIFDRTLSAPYDLDCSPAPYDLDCSPAILSVSATGSMLAWCDRKTVKIGVFRDKGRGIDVMHVLEGDNNIYLLFSPDEQYLITYCEKACKVYSCKSGSLVMDLTPEDKVFRSFGNEDTDFSRKVFVTADNKLIQPGFGYMKKNSHYVRQIPSKETLFHWEGFEHYEMDVGYLESREDFFIAGSTSETVINGDIRKQAKVFNIRTGRKVSVLNCLNGPYQDLNMFGGAEVWVLAACPRDPVVHVVSVGLRESPLEEAVLMRNISDHSQGILQILVSADEKLMFSASADNTIKLWDLPRLLDEARNLHAESKTSGTVDEDEVDEDEVDEDDEEDDEDDGVERKEKMDTDEKMSLPTNIDDLGQSNVLQSSKSGEELFIATKKGFVMKRDMSTGSLTYIAKENLSARQKRLICVTSSGKHVAVALKGRVLVLDVKTSRNVYNLKHLANEISCLAEGGNVLIAGTAGMEGKARLWNLENGEVIRDVEFLYSFYQTAINSTGTKLIMTMFDYPFIVDVYSKENDFEMRSQPDTMMYQCCATGFSPDDRFAVACSGDGTIRVMEADSNRYIYNMRQRSSITSMTFSPDSNDLVTSGYRSIYVWTLTDGSLTCKLTRHQSFIVCMEFARDGDILVSSCQDKTIVVWDYRRKMSICSFLAHCQVNAMALTPDLSTLTYAPENVASVAELKPNQTLCQILDGKYVSFVSESVKQAQALAFGFSSQTIAKQSSATCVLL